MRLLIIEDDKALALVMRKGLEKGGFTVDISNAGISGEEKAFVNDYDVILLDLNLPDKDGIEVLTLLREENIGTPIIIITARDEITELALGLNKGADDYVVKPFDFVELEARIRAVVRRSYNHIKNDLVVGKIKIIPHTRKAFFNDIKIELSAKEFDILEYVVSRHPDVVSTADIVEHTYDEFADPFSSVLRVHIANLRKKLNGISGQEFLISVRGKGYRLCDD